MHVQVRRGADPEVPEALGDRLDGDAHGFEYENGEPPNESTEPERLAWGLGLFGPEDDTVQWVDGDGNVVGEILVGGCLGEARDAVTSRQSYLDLQQIGWDAETLSGAATGGTPVGDLGAELQSLEETWRGLRRRLLTALANAES